jgi:hypothetical protein
MRWSARVVLSLAVVACLVAVASTAVGSGGQSQSAAKAGRADLTVSSLSEPPDRRNRGTTFSVSFTVANQGNVRASRGTKVAFYLVKRAGDPRRGDIRLRGSSKFGALSSGQDESGRKRVRIPTRTKLGLYFLTACATRTGPKSSTARTNCAVSGQRMRILRHFKGLRSVDLPAEFRIDRTTLPIGRPTIAGAITNGSSANGDAEHSTQRKVLAKVGPVSLVGDCKRTTNGDRTANNGPDQPNTQPATSSNSFDENGDEAKLLIYTDNGTITFNSMGNSSRRNITQGEGQPGAQRDAAPSSKALESQGGEGKHMAIAAARDPEQGSPAPDWVTAYKVNSIYISHSGGQEMVFTGYVGIDVLGVGNNCVFGGVLNVVKL